MQKSKRAITTTDDNPKKPKNNGCVWWFVILFGLILLGVRLVPWLTKAHQAGSWVATPCQVLSAKVEEKHNTKKPTYFIDVNYQYIFKGKKYQSSVYGIVNHADSRYKSKQQIVKNYRKDPHSICYVNPASPEQAVLNRELGGLPFWGLFIFSIVLVAGGTIGVKISNRKYQRKKALAGRYDYAQIEERFKYNEFTPLKVKGGPTQQFFILLSVAIFWNGATAIAFTKAITSSPIDRSLIIVTVLFAIVGLLLLIGVCYRFMKLFAPIPEVRIDKDSITPGGPLKISWSFADRCDRLKNLNLELVCVKTFLKKRHKNDIIAKSDIMTIKIAQLTNKSDLRIGDVTANVPADAQVTMLGDYPRYNWYIRFSGKMKKRPKLKLDYEFAVIPKNHS